MRFKIDPSELVLPLFWLVLFVIKGEKSSPKSEEHQKKIEAAEVKNSSANNIIQIVPAEYFLEADVDHRNRRDRK